MGFMYGLLSVLLCVDTSAAPFVVSSLLLQFLFRDPKWSSWAILRCLPSKATIGFSNMRGPAGRWSLSGHPVARIHNGVQPNAFGCFISLFSYGDMLTFTHTCYTSKTEHPEVCDSFVSSLVGCLFCCVCCVSILFESCASTETLPA